MVLIYTTICTRMTSMMMRYFNHMTAFTMTVLNLTTTIMMWTTLMLVVAALGRVCKSV